jgi:amino acid adenylation domain-containing protein/non-ribosomal peptide synthase protein (TIGR01720 family)
MVPHYFVELDTLPLTSNGKVNRRELPDPDELHTEYATPYIPPQNEIQQQLVEVYQEVLKKKPVSIKENFFVLGGDSIKSIQIVSKLKQRGYTLAIRDILSHPVIEELEQYVNKSTRAAEQGATEGLIPLSPIQTAFLQNDFSLKYHYNQSVLLQSSEPVSPEGIRMALNKIVQHHDILRAVFRKEETGWIQENRGEGQYYSFEIIENADDELFIAHCERIQSTASLAEGPLFRVCLFRNQGADRLLMVIHHLLVDGVSWRILFEDLAALYNQYLQGQPLVLPPKTDSFRYWMQQQAAYATSPDLQQQEEYWSAIESGSYAPLPADNPEGLNTAGDAVTISFALDNETTERLLTGCYQAYRTDVNDILLTAFGLSLREIFDPGKVLIKMEGHGREDTGMNTDVSRTVGWFTTTYPVVLNMEYSSDIIRQLIEIKETLHRVPEKGLGYGVLRYLANKNYKLEPQITFNYLGDFGTGVHAKGNHQLFTFSGGYHGKDMPDSLQRDAMLDITGIIAGKELQLSITYSKEQYGTATMENLSGCFRKKLETLVQLLSAEKKQQLSPVDLTWNKLTVEQVNKLNKLGLEDVYPLSPLQLGLYYHWLSEPDSPVYVQQISYRLKGSLAIAAVEKSYQELIARHAMLRTCFSHEWSDRPLQMVFNKTASSFEYNDATGKAELSPAWFKKADQAKGFNLHSGTQMRLTVLKLENAVHEFVWTFHHIIMDGWSVARLMTEFFEIYRNTTSGITEGPAEMNSYANYISWLEKKDKTLSLDYWTDYLTGYDTVACIPRLPGNKRKGYRGEKLTLEISGNKREALRRRCAGEGITENNFFLALWGLLLGKYNNTTDVVFGTVVSGRATEVRGVENIVGLFINTIPVRVKTGEEITLQNLLRNVQKESVDAGAHHYVQLAELQSRSELGRNLFDHIVVFENYPVQEVIDKSVGDQHTGERLEVTAVQLAEQSSYDFFITIVPGKNIEVNFNYNACVLGEMQLQRLQEHFDQLITLALKDKGQLVKNCTYTSEGEEQLLLHTFNDTAHPYRANQTLVSLFEEQVAAAPDREILKFDKVSLTFRELNETANQLSAYLRKQYGVQPDDRVCIKLERSEWMIIAILGVLKSGGAYVPVDPAYPEERIAYMLGDSNSKVLLDEKELQHFRKQQAQYSKENQQLISRPSGLAYIIYTSGSTGRPKGCMLEHGSIVNRLQWMWEQYGFTKEDVILQKTTFTFDVSVWELFLPLCYGATMVLCHREDIAVPERIVSLIRQHKVSCMHFVPSMMNAFTGNLFERDTIGEELQSLRLIITSGEALPVQTLKNWYAKVPVPVHNLYGPTEASVDVSFYATSPTDEMVLIGKPVWNTQLYITGQDGQLQSPGIPGEICIAGVGLARGYINNPELTTEKFVNNPFRPGTKMYRTGDIGRWLEDGNIEYIGRKDGQVKIRGHRVETGEVEAVLLDHPDIESCVVTVQSSGGNVNELRACIVSRTLLNIVELRQWLSNKLPLYMIPAQFIQLEQLPLTASGKADRKALQQLPVQTLQAGVEYIPARNETEELLSSIWRQLLGERQISITENFFDAGGDSIRLIELSGLVSRAIGKEISIPVLFQYPTISDLAAYLANETKAYDVPDYDRTELMDDISKFS